MLFQWYYANRLPRSGRNIKAPPIKGGRSFVKWTKGGRGLSRDSPRLALFWGDEKCRSRVIHTHTQIFGHIHTRECERGRHGSKSSLSFGMDRGHARAAFLDLITRMLRAVYYALLYRCRAESRWAAPQRLGRPREFIKGTTGLHRPIRCPRIICTLINYSLPLLHRGCNFILPKRLTNAFQTINISLRRVKGENAIACPLYHVFRSSYSTIGPKTRIIDPAGSYGHSNGFWDALVFSGCAASFSTEHTS